MVQTLFAASIAAILAFSKVALGLQSAQFSSASEVQPRGHTWIITNADTSPLIIWIEGQMGHLRQTLAPGKILAVYNIPIVSGSTALRAIFENSPEDSVTKMEFMLGHELGGNIVDTINNSCVDGYNTRIAVEFDGGSCKNMETYVPQSKVIANCPSDNLVQTTGPDGQGHATCMSDCKKAEKAGGPSSHYCCEGKYHSHESCLVSNQYLAEHVKDSAYLWPHDNRKQQTCKIGKITRIYIGGESGKAAPAPTTKELIGKKPKDEKPVDVEEPVEIEKSVEEYIEVDGVEETTEDEATIEVTRDEEVIPDCPEEDEEEIEILVPDTPQDNTPTSTGFYPPSTGSSNTATVLTTTPIEGAASARAMGSVAALVGTAVIALVFF